MPFDVRTYSGQSPSADVRLRAPATETILAAAGAPLLAVAVAASGVPTMAAAGSPVLAPQAAIFAQESTLGVNDVRAKVPPVAPGVTGVASPLLDPAVTGQLGYQYVGSGAPLLPLRATAYGTSLVSRAFDVQVRMPPDPDPDDVRLNRSASQPNLSLSLGVTAAFTPSALLTAQAAQTHAATAGFLSDRGLVFFDTLTLSQTGTLVFLGGKGIMVSQGFSQTAGWLPTAQLAARGSLALAQTASLTEIARNTAQGRTTLSAGAAWVVVNTVTARASLALTQHGTFAFVGNFAARPSMNLGQTAGFLRSDTLRISSQLTLPAISGMTRSNTLRAVGTLGLSQTSSWASANRASLVARETLAGTATFTTSARGTLGGRLTLAQVAAQTSRGNMVMPEALTLSQTAHLTETGGLLLRVSTSLAAHPAVSESGQVRAIPTLSLPAHTSWSTSVQGSVVGSLSLPAHPQVSEQARGNLVASSAFTQSGGWQGTGSLVLTEDTSLDASASEDATATIELDTEASLSATAGQTSQLQIDAVGALDLPVLAGWSAGRPTVDFVPSFNLLSSAAVTYEGVAFSGITPDAITSGEAFGTFSIAAHIIPSSIPSQEQFGGPLSGTFTGSGGIVGSMIRVRLVSGLLKGNGSLSWAAPLPLRGAGSLIGFIQVNRAPGSICNPCKKGCGHVLHGEHGLLADLLPPGSWGQHDRSSGLDLRRLRGAPGRAPATSGAGATDPAPARGWLLLRLLHRRGVRPARDVGHRLELAALPWGRVRVLGAGLSGDGRLPRQPL